jgi:hypothetical protein
MTTVLTPAAEALPSAEITPTPTDVFIVDVWVSNPDPAPTETVIILGTLRRNGLYLNHVTMNATWPDEDNPRNMPNCTVQVLYQRGVCSTLAGKYPPGVYVPIDISFTFRGKTYTGTTGFTPK